MKLIHKTLLGKYSANATGVEERRISSAQRRHLVNNIVSTGGGGGGGGVGWRGGERKKVKKRERKGAHSFFPRYLSFFPLPPSHDEGHQQTSKHLPAVFQCFHHHVIQTPSVPAVSAALQTAGWSRPTVLLVMAWLPPLGMGTGSTKELLGEGTGWRLQSVMGLLLGFTSDYAGFPKLPPVSGYLLPLKDLLTKQNIRCVGWDPASETMPAQTRAYI